MLFQILVIERLQLVKRNNVILSAVIEVCVRSPLYHKKLFIVGVLVSVYHILIRIFSEVERMCLVTVKHHDSRAYLVAVLQDRHIDERHTADLVPAAVGIERTRVITSFSLVVRMVIFYEIRCVFGQRIDNTAAKVHKMKPADAQTGPAQRGDQAVMEHQIEVLKAPQPPKGGDGFTAEEKVAVYQALAALIGKGQNH